MPRGSGDPVLMLQGLEEAKIVPDGAQGPGALMTSWGIGQDGRHPQASGYLTTDMLLTPLVGYAYY
jgi:hypothetical protein